MTRGKAKTVKPGDLVSYIGPDSVIQIRMVYGDKEYMQENMGNKGCTVGAVLEFHGLYEIHQRKGSTYKNPFGLEDKVMTNGNMYHFDPKLKALLDKGFISLGPGQHGTIEGIDMGRDKVLVAFNSMIWSWPHPDAFGDQRPNKIWVDYRSICFVDKPTPRVSTLEVDDELLLLL